MSAFLNPALASHLNGVARLTHLGVIEVSGEDAAKFLHGQLTQDVALMGPSEARLAAFCSAKGRMLASFVMTRQGPQGVRLVCQRDLLAPTLKRLSMFVLRAKAQLRDASDDLAVYGLAGDALQALAPDWPAGATKLDLGAATLARLPAAGGVTRALWVGPASEPAPAGATLSADLWVWGEVLSGVAPVSAATVEAFVPQMLNYESVGGVNFKKGCYPGQEVVARSQFRGTLKRRGFILHGEVAMAAGQPVFAAADASQPAGTIALAAPSPLGGFDAIASLQVAATEGKPLHLDAADGPALALRPLPYALLDDI